MTQQEESSKKYAADGHCYNSSTSKKRGGAEEEPDGDEISPRFPNHDGDSAAKWKTTKKSGKKNHQGKTSQLVVKSVTVEKLPPPPPHTYKKGPRSSTKKDALKADNRSVENTSSTFQVEPNKKGEPNESAAAQRRRQAGQFRSNQPGAYPVGGIEDEQDGTVVVGGTTVIHTAGDEENGGMEPLPALLVGDSNSTNQDLELVHATKARGGPFRNRSCLIAVLILVFIGAMAIGLGVGLSSNKSKSAEESDDWSIPPILVQWSRIPLEILGSNQNDQLGLSVALSGDGSKLVAGAPLATATSPYAKVYDLLLLEASSTNTTNTTALLHRTIEAPSGSGEFGYGASLSMDGSVLTIGSESGGYVVVDDNPVARPYTAGTGLVSFDSAVSADGSTVAFGLQRVAVYRYSSSTTSFAGGRRWIQIGSNLIGDTFQDLLGWSLSLSADGNRLAAGSPGSDANGESTGSIRVYDWDGSEWVRLGSDISGIGDYDSFGVGVALSNDGRCVAGGAPQNGDFSAGFSEAESFRSGYVQVHCLQEGEWVQRGQTIAGQSDSWFGNSVDLSADGRTLIVGAPGSSRYAGEVTIYRLERDQWIRTAKFDGDEDTLDQCGFVVSLSSDGRVAAAGCPFKNTLAASSVGAVRVFRAFPCTEEDLDSVTPCRLGR